MILVTIGIIVVAQRTKDLGQVVHHEAIAIGEHLATDDVDLPARDIEMDAVKECGVVEFVGQLVKTDPSA